MWGSLARQFIMHEARWHQEHFSRFKLKICVWEDKARCTRNLEKQFRYEMKVPLALDNPIFRPGR